MASRKKHTKWEDVPFTLRNGIISDFLAKRITSFEAAGRLNVSRSTFSRHVHGRNKGSVGRPAVKSISGGSKKVGVQVHITGSTSKKYSSAAFSVKRLLGETLLLNRFFRRKSLMVEQISGRYMEYVDCGRLADGTTKYRCLFCKKVKGGKGGAACVYGVGGRIVGRTQPVHRCSFAGFSLEETVSREIDRRARKRVLDGKQIPMQAWKDGVTQCFEICKANGLPIRGTGSIPFLFPAWPDVGNQYCRLRRGENLVSSGKRVYSEIETSPFSETWHAKYAKKRSGERWLLAKSENLGVILFASDLDIELLAESETLQCDATFKTSPRGFYQVLTFHAEINGEWGCVASALMESKKEEAYQFVFDSLVSRSRGLGHTWKTKIFLTDFEVAEMKAAISAVGPDVVKGCLFHFTKAVLNQVKHYFLWRYYGREFGAKNIIWLWVRQIIALPLIPPELVRIVWEKYLVTPPSAPNGWAPHSGFSTWPTDELKKFSDYFENTWINSSVFPIKRWNHYRTGVHRTTNASEAYHSVLSRCSSTLIHPSVSNFLRDLQQRHGFQHYRFDQLKGKKRPRRKHPKYVELQNKLDGYLDRYEKFLSVERGKGKKWDSVDIIQGTWVHLQRCSFLLADLDASGNTTRKQGKPKSIGVVASTKLTSKAKKRPQVIHPSFPQLPGIQTQPSVVQNSFSPQSIPLNSTGSGSVSVPNVRLIPWGTRKYYNTCPLDCIMSILLLEAAENQNFLAKMVEPVTLTPHLVRCMKDMLGGEFEVSRTLFFDVLSSLNSTLVVNGAWPRDLEGNEYARFLKFFERSWTLKVETKCSDSSCSKSSGSTFLRKEADVKSLAEIQRYLVDPDIGNCSASIPGAAIQRGALTFTGPSRRCSGRLLVSRSFVCNSPPWMLPVTIQGLPINDCFNLPRTLLVSGKRFHLKGFTLCGRGHFTAVITSSGHRFFYDGLRGGIFRNFDAAHDMSGKEGGTAVYLIDA